MQESTNEQDLKDRLSFIEKMIAEGRRSTESWGWIFVLWGVAYYAAMAWSSWGSFAWAWPIIILAAVVVSAIMVPLKSSHQPKTTLGRSVRSVWTALGISMFVLFIPLGVSGRLADPHLFPVLASGILGMANGASALMLRWKLQFACAAVWWTAAVISCFGGEEQSTIAFLVAIFLCQIVFGIYCMAAEARQRKRRSLDGAVHA
jgi:hypothetical protein